jgi:hypothetical protein
MLRWRELVFCPRIGDQTSYSILVRRKERIMKRIRIIHKTEYFYNQPVKFGPHRAMMRPREGHDAHIAGAWVNAGSRSELAT